jgi:hypothetical protein
MKITKTYGNVPCAFRPYQIVITLEGVTEEITLLHLLRCFNNPQNSSESAVTGLANKLEKVVRSVGEC